MGGQRKAWGLILVFAGAVGAASPSGAEESRHRGVEFQDPFFTDVDRREGDAAASSGSGGTLRLPGRKPAPAPAAPAKAAALPATEPPGAKLADSEVDAISRTLSEWAKSDPSLKGVEVSDELLRSTFSGMLKDELTATDVKDVRAEKAILDRFKATTPDAISPIAPVTDPTGAATAAPVAAPEGIAPQASSPAKTGDAILPGSISASRGEPPRANATAPGAPTGVAAVPPRPAPRAQPFNAAGLGTAATRLGMRAIRTFTAHVRGFFAGLAPEAEREPERAATPAGGASHRGMLASAGAAGAKASGRTALFGGVVKTSVESARGVKLYSGRGATASPTYKVGRRSDGLFVMSVVTGDSEKAIAFWDPKKLKWTGVRDAPESPPPSATTAGAARQNTIEDATTIPATRVVLPKRPATIPLADSGGAKVSTLPPPPDAVSVRYETPRTITGKTLYPAKGSTVLRYGDDRYMFVKLKDLKGKGLERIQKIMAADIERQRKLKEEKARLAEKDEKDWKDMEDAITEAGTPKKWSPGPFNMLGSAAGAALAVQYAESEKIKSSADASLGKLVDRAKTLRAQIAAQKAAKKERDMTRDGLEPEDELDRKLAADAAELEKIEKLAPELAKLMAELDDERKKALAAGDEKGMKAATTAIKAKSDALKAKTEDAGKLRPEEATGPRVAA